MYCASSGTIDVVCVRGDMERDEEKGEGTMRRTNDLIEQTHRARECIENLVTYTHVNASGKI